jgi:L-fuconolactonase
VLIDAHQHFWQVGRNGFVWPTPDLERIHCDYLPRDLDEIAARWGVTGSVLVQSQPSDLDTDWVLDMAQGSDLVRGVVGWVDLLAPGAAERIAHLATRPKFRGVRPMLQSLPDDAWIARRDLDPAIDALVAHDLSLDALVLTRHLDALRALAARRRDLSFIIDHGAKPPIAGGDFDLWARGIADLAAFDNVTCKLSGLLTEAGPRPSPDAIAPYVQHLIASFGPDRLMWGSDWPVVNLVASYGDWLVLAQRLCGLESAAQVLALFGGTARRVYRLEVRP